MEKKEMVPSKYERLQGKEWTKVKKKMKLLYTYTSDKGNIKGIFTDGKRRVSHWFEEKEKELYLADEQKED